MGEAKRRKTQDPSFGKTKDFSNFKLENMIPISLPLERIPDGNWTEALEYLQKPWVKEAKNITDAYKIVKEVFWLVVLELIIKQKWLKDYQLPSDRAFQNIAKPKSELLFSILELTIQCHSFASNEYPEKMPPTASAWFGLIFMEYKCADLKGVYEGRVNMEKEKRWQRDNLINELLDYNNPYPIDTHIWHLMNVAIPLARNSPQIREDYWNRFVKAVRNDVNRTLLDKEDIKQVWIENGALYGSLSGQGKGSGKGKQLICEFQ
jgi:hypothetical protein